MAHVYVTRLDDPSEGSRLLWTAIQSAGSQRAVGKKIGVATSTVSVWLRGEQRPGYVLRTRMRTMLRIPLGSWDVPPRVPFTLSGHVA